LDVADYIPESSLIIPSDFLSRFRGVKRSGAGYSALCPSHDDHRNSLSINVDRGRILVTCHARRDCTHETICAAAGLEVKDLFLNPPSRGGKDQKRLEAVYDYEDETGKVRYQNLRYLVTHPDGTTDKTFYQRHFDERGNVVWGLKSVGRLPYNLPGLIGGLREQPSRPVLLAEGEKDCDNLNALGFITSNLKNWRREFNRFIKGAQVVLIADHDESGIKQATDTARIISSCAAGVKLIDLYAGEPLPEKHGPDVSDWLEAEHNADELRAIIDNAPFWTRNEEPKAGGKITGFHFKSLSDLLDEPEEQIDWVWSKTLPVGGFSILSAKPKVGKSTVGRNLAKCVSGGEVFLGRQTTKGPVIYLGLEEKSAEIKRHFAAMGARGNGILIYAGAPPDNALEALAAAVAEHSPILVIIDPLSRVLRVRDFNDYGTMARGLEPFIDLARRLGTHILALHHEGKGGREGGDSVLGSTALFGAVDCLIQMKKRERGRTITTTNRYGEDLPETVIELDRSTGIITAQGDLQSIALRDKQQEVLEAIADGELTEAEIKERFTGSSGLVSKAIRVLHEKGKLIRLGKGGRGNPYTYRTAESKNPENLTNPDNPANPTNLGQEDDAVSRFMGFTYTSDPENPETQKDNSELTESGGAISHEVELRRPANDFFDEMEGQPS
jgi:hypothetical protein